MPDKGRNTERKLYRAFNASNIEVGFVGGREEPLKSKGKAKKKLLEDSEQRKKLFSDTKYNCSFRYSV